MVDSFRTWRVLLGPRMEQSGEGRQRQEPMSDSETLGLRAREDLTAGSISTVRVGRGRPRFRAWREAGAEEGGDWMVLLEVSETGLLGPGAMGVGGCGGFFWWTVWGRPFTRSLGSLEETFFRFWH